MNRNESILLVESFYQKMNEKILKTPKNTPTVMQQFGTIRILVMKALWVAKGAPGLYLGLMYETMWVDQGAPYNPIFEFLFSAYSTKMNETFAYHHKTKVSWQGVNVNVIEYLFELLTNSLFVSLLISLVSYGWQTVDHYFDHECNVLSSWQT